MFGRLLGKVLALPIRVANLPMAVADKMIGGDGDPLLMRELADIVEDEAAKVIDGEEDD